MNTFVNKIAFLASVIMIAAPAITWCEVVEPHCSDGDCSAYATWCRELGRDTMCLDHGTEHEVTVCLGPRALIGIWNNHPNACYGTCAGATLCNDETTTLTQDNLDGEPAVVGMFLTAQSPTQAGPVYGRTCMNIVEVDPCGVNGTEDFYAFAGTEVFRENLATAVGWVKLAKDYCPSAHIEVAPADSSECIVIPPTPRP
jgi:hypothetical protein